jgi:hypothetical protein
MRAKNKKNTSRDNFTALSNLIANRARFIENAEEDDMLEILAARAYPPTIMHDYEDIRKLKAKTLLVRMRVPEMVKNGHDFVLHISGRCSRRQLLKEIENRYEAQDLS